jgi:hypothetical protein
LNFWCVEIYLPRFGADARVYHVTDAPFGAVNFPTRLPL